jgi:hypothetical protein
VTDEQKVSDSAKSIAGLAVVALFFGGLYAIYQIEEIGKPTPVVTAETVHREFKNVGETGKISSTGTTWAFETEAELDRYTKATLAKDSIGINQALYEAHQLAPGLRALVIDRTIATRKVRMLEGSTAIIEQAYWVYQEDIE